MVIIQLDGGLGNQMFEYALHYSFLQKGVASKLDRLKYEKEPAHNGYELERIFNLNASYSSKFQREIIKSVSKLLHVLFKHTYKEKEQWQWAYQKEVADIRFGFLKGYWQAEEYFKDASNGLRGKFKFPALSDKKNIEAFAKINNTNSVSLHIRRGDYLFEGRNCSLGMDYYTKAIDLINQKVANPSFFIFSDDVQWAKENIEVNEGTFVDWNKGNTSYIDMQLMSCCKHNIIANSSFSWWAAWLNNNPFKNVIMPSPWMPGKEKQTGLLVSDWTKIPVMY